MLASWNYNEIEFRISTYEMAFLSGRKLSLKDWQKARLTTLMSSTQYQAISQVAKFSMLGGTPCGQQSGLS